MNAAAALHARWTLDAGAHEHAMFLVEGMHCAGCARGIESAVRALPEVESVKVNAATARVAVDWRGGGSTTLPRILDAVVNAGFTPVPLAGLESAQRCASEQRAALKRLGLASLGMMQAMMYLGALYGTSDIDAAMMQLMRVAGMVIVTPVLFYSGAPFLIGAWRDLRNRRLGMDVPVALALLLAWLPSVVNTMRGAGEIYFDSVGMFIFFLCAGRYVEMSVRHRQLAGGEALARSLPARVIRLASDGTRHLVALDEIAPNDRFSVPKGSVVAVDARLAPGMMEPALLDESLLTGESVAVRRRCGETIRGGSVNVGGPLILVADAAAKDSTLASIVALLGRAQAERPALASAADRAASWFVGSILVLSVLTAVAWTMIDPARALPAVLAVLVVTCPCALSLATPAAIASSTTALSRLGVLVTRVDAIERLARVDTVILDKTGTLTESSCAIANVRLLSCLSASRALAHAAALERGSAHPLADAFRVHEDSLVVAQSIREFEAEGIEGEIEGRRWRLGRRPFVAGVFKDAVARRPPVGDDATTYLGDESGMVAAIDIGAPLRAEAREAVRIFEGMGLSLVIASGDSERAVSSAARALGLRDAHARLAPSDKVKLLTDLRARGRRVFALGDGINDGPVLAAADVSCAMGQGSAIAQAAADLLLVDENLLQVARAVAAARRALRIVKQNLGWAIAYNLSAVPLAAAGLVSPWVAALGMSLSSLAVVLNARRLATPERAG
jgi:P-type Cu2+ transporter